MQFGARRGGISMRIKHLHVVRAACGTSPATLADHIVNESTLDPTNREFQKGRTFTTCSDFRRTTTDKEDQCFGNGREDRQQSDRKAIPAECFKLGFIITKTRKKIVVGHVVDDVNCRIHNIYIRIYINFLLLDEK